MQRIEPCTSGGFVCGWAGWLSPPRSVGLAPVAIAPCIHVQVLLVQVALLLVTVVGHATLPFFCLACAGLQLARGSPYRFASRHNTHQI